MERNRSAFEAGQALKSSGIPAKTKCIVCKRVKQISQFSSKQLDALRLSVRRYGQAAAVPKDGLIRCRDCSGVQNREMKCNMCLKTKPLEAFSLAQRSKKDDAICLNCHEDLDETHPDDRKLATAHDNTLAYNKQQAEEIDDSSSVAESEHAAIWLWDPETGDYVTEESLKSRATGVPGSDQSTASDINQMDIRPWTGARRAQASISRSDGSALTRKNLAKLTVSEKLSTGKSSKGAADSDSSSSSSAASNASGVALPLQARAGNIGGARASANTRAKGSRTASASAHVRSHTRGQAGSDGDGDENFASGPLFRAYDPSGAAHMQRRRQSTAASTAASTTTASPATSVIAGRASATLFRRTGAATHGEWHGRTYVKRHNPDEDDESKTREEDEEEENRHRTFARVRPQNNPSRRYVDDAVAVAALLAHATPSRTGINTGVMEDVSSDED